jgi:hypothetical protein
MDASDIPPLEHPVDTAAEPARRDASMTRRALIAGFTVFSPQHRSERLSDAVIWNYPEVPNVRIGKLQGQT